MVTVLGENGYLGSVVKRRWLERGDTDHIVNCIRPDDVEVTGRHNGSLFIQPSTDAIHERSAYANVKRWIEDLATESVIIRAGIVDTRQEYPVAYWNWRCNPLTPLEWADYAYDHRDEPGLHSIGRESLTRYNVAAAVAVVFDRPYPRPGWADEPLDRTQRIGDFPPLYRALIEYREWLRS
jgi:hypothetical protein